MSIENLLEQINSRLTILSKQPFSERLLQELMTLQKEQEPSIDDKDALLLVLDGLVKLYRDRSLDYLCFEYKQWYVDSVEKKIFSNVA